MYSHHRWSQSIGILALLMISGCGSDLPATIPVEATVTFDGRDMPTSAIIIFRTVEAAPGYPTRPARGVMDTDGDIEVTAFETGDGLVPGKYSVMIEYFDVRPGGNIHDDADVTRYVAQLGELDVAPDHSGAIELSYTIPAQ